MPQDTVTVNLPVLNPDSIPGINEALISQRPAEAGWYDSTFVKQEKYYNHLGDQIMVLESVVIAAVLTLLAVRQYKHRKNTDHRREDAMPYASYDGKGRRIYTVPSVLTYEGRNLNLSEAAVTNILLKRFPYFSALSAGERRRFLLRHKKFMRSKIFKIHDDEGFIEMPVLVSAAAVQLSFGLTEFLLPQYSFINIFPREFMRVEPVLQFLEGNVSGNNIKISWKHFLEGYALPDNGENVGLHEMAHAYYSQNFLCGEDEDDCFVTGFNKFNQCGMHAYDLEQISEDRFYSDYALRNFQEFWAESVERFFEKPQQLKAYYPDVYDCMCAMLNQVPG